MTDEHEPVEEYDGTVTVHVLTDGDAEQKIPCSSFREAIDAVKRRQGAATVVKIVARDGDVVFTSATMDIEDWEREWKHAKRQLSVDVEEWDCPYDNMACFSDDLCVQCKMDKVQDSY